MVKNLSPKVTLSIENMDHRKRNCSSLEDISEILDRYPKLHCTFDICHWLELLRGALDRDVLTFLSRYQERVSKVHYSVPSSLSEVYKNSREISTNHFLTTFSGFFLPYEFFSLFQPEAEWVIEGVIPFGHVDTVEHELDFLQRVLHPEQYERVQRAA